MLPNTTLLQRGARTAVEAGPCSSTGLGLRNGPGACVVPLMIFAVRGSGHLVRRCGVVTIVVVSVIPVGTVVILSWPSWPS